jgi:hypothetical protein
MDIEQDIWAAAYKWTGKVCEAVFVAGTHECEAFGERMARKYRGKKARTAGWKVKGGGDSAQWFFENSKDPKLDFTLVVGDYDDVPDMKPSEYERLTDEEKAALVCAPSA